MIRQSGGSIGVRDEGLLDLALNAPFQTFWGQDLYQSIEEKAARLCFGLIKNHPFFDGNKRTAAHCLFLFLGLNGIFLDYTQDDLVKITLDLAAGKGSYELLLSWIKRRRSR